MKYSSMRSALVTLLVLVLVLFGQVPTAKADKPITEPFPSGSVLIDDACPFEVLVEDLVNKATITTFVDKQGNPVRILVSGAYRNKLTNQETHKSLGVKIPGPARYIINPDGTLVITALGPSLNYLSSDAFPEFPMRLFVNYGQVIFTYPPTGDPTLQVRGQTLDICAALAE